jgi:hypothetical protein
MEIRTTGYHLALPATPRSIRVGMTIYEAIDLRNELQGIIDNLKANDEFVYFTIEGESYG